MSGWLLDPMPVSRTSTNSLSFNTIYSSTNTQDGLYPCFVPASLEITIIELERSGNTIELRYTLQRRDSDELSTNCFAAVCSNDACDRSPAATITSAPISSQQSMYKPMAAAIAVFPFFLGKARNEFLNLRELSGLFVLNSLSRYSLCQGCKENG